MMLVWLLGRIALVAWTAVIVGAYLYVFFR